MRKIIKYRINVVCCVGSVQIYKSKYKKVGVLPTRIVKSNVSSVGPSSERNVSLINSQNVNRFKDDKKVNAILILVESGALTLTSFSPFADNFLFLVSALRSES